MSGTVSRAANVSEPFPAVRRNKRALRIGIVGAGFSGIGLAIQLKRAGYSNIVIFEKAERLGGTWRDNTYPGAACDVRSHLYSFSFAPKSDWPSSYSSQADILGYLEEIASRFNILPLIRFKSAATRAVYDEATATWTVETAQGESAVFDVFVTAVGQLSIPKVPAIEGRDAFDGSSFHSAAWDHRVPLQGKRIAIIGSAASAVQIVPELAKVAAHLAVYQRTPNWIIPRFNRRYGALELALFRYVPLYRQLVRGWIYWTQEMLFNALRTGSRLNKIMSRISLWHLHRQVHNSDLRARLTPQYEFGCKRVLLSDDYLPCFNRADVELITEPIEGFETAGVRTVDGKSRPFDLVIFATGFDVRNCLRPVEIRGRGGVDLQKRWSQGPEAYRGVAVPDFPNLFLLYGPNTNLGHNSILFMLECQFHYIVQCVDRIVGQNLHALEVSPEAMACYNQGLQKQMAGMVWTTGCGNWYGNGARITANWTGSTVRYWLETRRVKLAHFLEHPSPADRCPDGSAPKSTHSAAIG